MQIEVKKSNYFSESASQTFEQVITIKNNLGIAIEEVFLSSYNSVELKDMKPNEIDSFEKFQNSNIEKLSEAIKGKTTDEAIKYLNEIQEGFSFEIWVAKEKSWAAEVIKNQIRKTVESEKQKILPEYNPANLTKASRFRTKIKTESEEITDKTLKMFVKMGISIDDAKAAMKNMVQQTYEVGLSKTAQFEEKKFIKCKGCGALNMLDSMNCMVCQENLIIEEPAISNPNSNSNSIT